MSEKMGNPKIIRQLISQITRDDADAFKRLFDLYFPKVLQFSRYFMKSDEICQEITSDVFLSIWKNRRKLKSIKNLDAFIFTITKNKAYDHLNKISRQPDFVSDLPLEIHSGNNNPETHLLHTELLELINKSIEDLPPRCKLIFLMAREEGFKYQEIASILSISEKTVNAQMVTALKRLGEAIKKYFSSTQ